MRPSGSNGTTIWRSSPNGSGKCTVSGASISSRAASIVYRGCASPGTAGNTPRGAGAASAGARRRAPHHARRQFGDRKLDRDRPVPITARRDAQVGNAIAAVLREACQHAPAPDRRPRAKSRATGNCRSTSCKARASIGSTSNRAVPNSPAVSIRPISRARSAAGSTATKSSSRSRHATRAARSTIPSTGKSVTAA